MKTALRLILGVLLSPVILFVCLTAALYVPVVQDWAVNTAACLATEGTGLNVKVGRVGLSFPLDIDMQHVEATDSVGDTLLSVRSLVVDLDLCPLLWGQVGVDEVALYDGRVNTKQLIDGISVCGRLQRFAVAAPEGIDLKHNLVSVHEVEANGCWLNVKLGASEPDTTATEPLPWQINVAHLALDNTSLTIEADSLWACTDIEHIEASEVECDLDRQSYSTVEILARLAARVWLPAVCPDTLSLSPIDLQTAGACYNPAKLYLNSGELRLRNSEISLSLLATLNTQYDSACSGFGLPLHDFELRWGSHLDPRDMVWAAAVMGLDTTALARVIPQAPLFLGIAAAAEDMKHIELGHAEVSWPQVVMLEADGWVDNIADSLRRAATVNVDLKTHNLAVVKAMAGLGRDLRLPPMALKGRAVIDGQRYEAQAGLNVDGHDAVSMDAHFDAATEAYDASVRLTGLAPRSFMPSLPVGPVTASIVAEGQGLDYMSRATRMTARAELQRCTIDSIDASGVCLAASYRDRRATMLLDSNNPLLSANLSVNAKVETRDSCNAQFTLDLTRLDLYGMHLTQRPFAMGGTVHFEGGTNLTDRHRLKGEIYNMNLYTADSTFHPKDVVADLLLRPDTMAAHVSAGDLTLGFTSGCGVDSLLSKSDNFVTAINEQLRQYTLDQEQLRLMLPRAEVMWSMGDQNPAANIAKAMGYTIDGFKFRLGADPTIGLNGGVALNRLTMGAVTLDEMWCNIYQDSTGVKIDARVHNGPKNPQISFDARANAYILPQGAGLNLRYTDDKGRCGVDIGTVVDILPDGIRMRLTPLQPVVANRRFDVNAGNYLFMSPDGRVSADMDLLADDGTRLKVYSTDPDTTAGVTTLQDLTVSLHRLNVRELCSVLPYMPALGGLLFGDAHLVQTTDNLSVALDARVDGFSYEGQPVGDVALNATYLPLADSCHYVDALMMYGGDEVLSFSGTYTDDGADGQIDAQAEVTHLPLAMLGGLVADAQTLALAGDIDGLLTVTGSTALPRLDGRLSMDGVKATSKAYNLALRVADDTISISGNRLALGGIDVYSTGSSPMTVDGTVDFRDMANVSLDLRLMASRFELINARRTDASVAYGKVLVDAAATLRGKLQNLVMQGRLGVLGGTDVTYILQDSPLTVEDRLADLVTFVDFSDTLGVAQPEEVAPIGLTMNMMVSVDQSAQVHCLLSADRSSYIDIEGGGDLALTYTPQGDIGLTGRYTIISGEMKYELPVIPLKTFKLQSGSYLAWSGNIMNPTLNLAATERVRASVAQPDGSKTRTVAFDVGLSITQTLENMGLAFTVDAPEDASVQNELATMDATTRGRVAVTMLATGMYITDNGGGGFSTTNALNTFLQGELSTLAGKALQTVDVNVGVEESTNAAGATTTDYSFSFAKRFWNNRISISFGGKVSSGAEAQNTGATIIDNVALEYRLDQSATRYVRLAYDKNYESLLEGTVTEMSAGLVLRRKTTRLGELFIFRKKTKAL